jgi:hypothetical protein
VSSSHSTSSITTSSSIGSQVSIIPSPSVSTGFSVSSSHSTSSSSPPPPLPPSSSSAGGVAPPDGGVAPPGGTAPDGVS